MPHRQDPSGSIDVLQIALVARNYSQILDTELNTGTTIGQNRDQDCDEPRKSTHHSFPVPKMALHAITRTARAETPSWPGLRPQAGYFDADCQEPNR